MSKPKTITLTMGEDDFELMCASLYDAAIDKEKQADRYEDGSHLQELYQADADILYNIARVIEDKYERGDD